MGIERVRSEAIFNAMNKGLKRADEILVYADRAEMRVKMSRGKSSVNNFFNLVPKLGIVDHAFLATQHEDLHLGTDAWISLRPNHPFKLLPIQIKSSDVGVQEFKNSNVFKRVGELVLVLNTRRDRKHNVIVREFLSEYDRVVSKMSYLKDSGDPILDFILSKNNT